MKAALLDVNLLIALAWPNHEHHRVVRSWFLEKGNRSWATCPVTQAGFIRISSNPAIIEDAASPLVARELLVHLTSGQGHTFWPDSLDFTKLDNIPANMLMGHRQVTDAYLVQLARSQGGALATMDKGLFNTVQGSNLEESVFLVPV